MMILTHELIRHHIWATETLIAYCAGLPAETLQQLVPATQRTILNTLGHIVGTEQLYMQELTGVPAEAPIRAGEVPAIADLQQRFAAHARRWEMLLEQINDLQVNQPAHPPNLLLLQAIHHGIDHRTQICTALSLLGPAAPELDGWSYWDATHTPRQ